MYKTKLEKEELKLSATIEPQENGEQKIIIIAEVEDIKIASIVTQKALRTIEKEITIDKGEKGAQEGVVEK